MKTLLLNKESTEAPNRPPYYCSLKRKKSNMEDHHHDFKGALEVKHFCFISWKKYDTTRTM